MAAARADWGGKQPSLAPGRLSLLDGTSAKANMVREHGRAPRGERLVASVPRGHRKASTSIGCLHEGGIVVPCALDGELSVACVEQQVVPNLARGGALAMGTLPVHKAAGARNALEAAGVALPFLPAHNPGLNPVEMVLAKTKPLLRKAAIRTVDALWRALGKISQSPAHGECVDCSRHCGYIQPG